MRRILKNSIITPKGRELISRHIHNYVSYDGYSVDGGSSYLKRGFPTTPDYIENSVYDDGLHETRRNNISWGVNYTKEGKKLHQTQWKFIKDLNTNHIWAILLNIPNIDKFYKEVFIDEIIFREEQILKTYEK